MKYVIEFGVRGGPYTESMVLPTRALAEELARTLVAVFCNDANAEGAYMKHWTLALCHTRKTWQNRTHFVAVSKLDGVRRGPASAALWPKPNEGTEEMYSGVVLTSYT